MSASSHKGRRYADDSLDPNLEYLQTWTWPYPAEYLSPLGSAEAVAAGTAFYRWVIASGGKLMTVTTLHC